MKITDVKTVLLTGPCTNDPFLSETRKLRSAAFIEIHTDTKYMGLGETYGGYFALEMVPSIVDFWGYGGLSRETARLARAMGLRVHVLARNGVQAQENIYCVAGTGDPEGCLPDAVFRYEEKADFLGDLDYLVMGLPLNDDTRGIVCAEDLRALPPRAILLNPARGPLIAEDVLVQALREGWIAGAALDTHYHYPMPSEHPLWTMENVIMTPHISGSTICPCCASRAWGLLFAPNPW